MRHIYQCNIETICIKKYIPNRYKLQSKVVDTYTTSKNIKNTHRQYIFEFQKLYGTFSTDILKTFHIN